MACDRNKSGPPSLPSQKLATAIFEAMAPIVFVLVLRSLAESSDPGEKFGHVELKGLLEKLAENLTYVAEAGVVIVRVNCPEQLFVSVDPTKLRLILANVATILIRSAVPGGVITLSASRNQQMVDLNGTLESAQRASEEDRFQEDSTRSGLTRLGAMRGLWAATSRVRLRHSPFNSPR